MSNASSDFVVTKEHRRFAEFCDACRRYRYMGLCYGSPGVGKTLSARHYANWDKVAAYRLYTCATAEEFAEVVGSTTVFYTPPVVNSPGRIEQDIVHRRTRLQSLALEKLYREQAVQQEAVRQKEATLLRQYINDPAWMSNPPPPRPPPTAPTEFDIIKCYAARRDETPDPTSLVIIDETDRLKTAGLEQVRDIFARGDLGVVLIGMPGLEKRLSHYPQLYSRVGFVHAFRPLSAQEVRQLLHQRWLPAGIELPEEGWADEEALAAIIRITGGNFRLLHRLLTQIARIVEINALQQVTSQAVETARVSLVIGTA
jgi:DNA transposition AAA+ family ATPase